MVIAVIRKELDHLIDTADEKKLKAIHLLLENDINDHTYSNEELTRFYDILHRYEKGDIGVVEATVAHAGIRTKGTGIKRAIRFSSVILLCRKPKKRLYIMKE